MPQKICTLCVHQANSAHYFILKCKETDRMLKQHLYLTKTSPDALQIGIIDYDVNDDSDSKVYDIESLQPDECEEIADAYVVQEQQNTISNQTVAFGCDKCLDTFDNAVELQCHRDHDHSAQTSDINERFGHICHQLISSIALQLEIFFNSAESLLT